MYAEFWDEKGRFLFKTEGLTIRPLVGDVLSVVEPGSTREERFTISSVEFAVRLTRPLGDFIAGPTQLGVLVKLKAVTE